MTPCQGCGAEIPEGAGFCPSCGLAVGTEPPELPAWHRESPWRQTPERSWTARDPGRNADPDDAELLEADRSPGRRRRWLVAGAVVLLGLVAAAVVGLVHPGGQTAAPPVASSSQLALVTPSIRVSSTPVTGEQLIGTAPAVQPSSQLDAARKLLTRYFSAINDHNDYRGWRDTLVPRPGRGTSTDYQGYQTTMDSDISIDAIHPGAAGEVRVAVSFTSHQDPTLGKGHECLRWSISFTLTPYQGELRIGVNGISRINTHAC